MLHTGTGVPTIDEALGGLITGDNVVWISDEPAVYSTLADQFLASAVASGQRCLHVSFGSDRHWSATDVTELDASAASSLSRPTVLADELDRWVRSESPTCLVFDELERPLRRWGLEATIAFFSRVCPAMLDAGVTAYWSVHSGLGSASIESIRQITQCLIDVRSGGLRVLKAEGRSALHPGVTYRLSTADGPIVATVTPAGGRLAQGLGVLRADLGLTQRELATIAGVTPSAISQAESGTRGLSVETLVTIADRLNITLDRLVNAQPTPAYQLARHDRSRRVDDRVVALATDTTVGLRVYLIELEGGATDVVATEHRGVEVIAVARGLVQIDLGQDRPVLRTGDSLVVDRAAARSWRNLRREPARFFRILRD